MILSIFSGLQQRPFFLHGVGKWLDIIPKLLISCQPNIISCFGRFGLINTSICICLLPRIKSILVLPVISIFLLLASLISNVSEMTGSTFNLNLAARNVLAAEVVAPESGNDSIWLLLVPCIAVRIILGVADDIVFIFFFSWISDMIPWALMSERALMSIS